MHRISEPTRPTPSGSPSGCLALSPPAPVSGHNRVWVGNRGHAAGRNCPSRAWFRHACGRLAVAIAVGVGCLCGQPVEPVAGRTPAADVAEAGNAVAESPESRAAEIADTDSPALVDIAVCGPRSELMVAAHRPGRIDIREASTGNSVAFLDIATPVAAIVGCRSRNQVICADPAGETLTTCTAETSGDRASWRVRNIATLPDGLHEVGESRRHPLDTIRLAVSLGERRLALSDRRGKRVRLIPLDADGVPESTAALTVALPFCPQCLLPLPDEQFLVADAFGGRLVLVDERGRIRARHTLHGHQIRGLCLSSDGSQVLIAHQILSRVARTTQDDIHWGSLMQNVVTAIPVASLTTTAPITAATTMTLPVGDTGNGAADPSGLCAWRDGFVVASTGSDRVWVTEALQRPPRDLPVGIAPTRVVRLPDERLAVLNSLDATISVVDLAAATVVHTVGDAAEPSRPAERGRRAFFSGTLSHDRWMSCSSCHIDGHTADLLSDTLGDGGYGDPKRIPSLFGVADTPPWGWLGNQNTLDEQLRQTLATTMHGGITDENTVADLAAYLATLAPIPPRPLGGVPEASDGARVFNERGCGRCHAGPGLTSSKTFDVGIRDRGGNTNFNPPSLRGLRFRTRYLHDGRYSSLEELLDEHPDPDADPLSPAERAALTEYLLRI